MYFGIDLDFSSGFFFFFGGAMGSLVAQTVKRIQMQGRRPGLDPWVGKMS